METIFRSVVLNLLIMHQTSFLNKKSYSFIFCRVIVLLEGHIVQFDSPKKLLQNTEGIFYKMACDAGLV